jgi:hypothetical protein
MLDPVTIEIVEESWAKAAALGADKVGVLLFKNIFTIAPGVTPDFSLTNTRLDVLPSTP